jgi:NAD(P)-dependent dehydrogenase (short-subunit alcohol dehydrogenase family)
MAVHTFLVTGAASGFGLEIVLAALKAGHNAIAACRNTELAAAKAPRVEKLGGRWLRLDVTDPNAETIVRDAVQQHKVDVLVNNAGYAMLGSLEEMR